MSIRPGKKKKNHRVEHNRRQKKQTLRDFMMDATGFHSQTFFPARNTQLPIYFQLELPFFMLQKVAMRPSLSSCCQRRRRVPAGESVESLKVRSPTLDERSSSLSSSSTLDLSPECNDQNSLKQTNVLVEDFAKYFELKGHLGWTRQEVPPALGSRCSCFLLRRGRFAQRPVLGKETHNSTEWSLYKARCNGFKHTQTWSWLLKSFEIIWNHLKSNEIYYFFP